MTEEEFEFFYAITAKDQEKVNIGHATLDANQKMNVMQKSMMGPSKCANELAAQMSSSNSQNSAKTTTGEASATASGTSDSE